MASSLTTGIPLFRRALLLESAGNIFGGTVMILFPGLILKNITTSTTLSTPLASSLVQWMGALVLALTTPLILSYPNTTAGVAGRYITYWTLGMGEVALMAVMAGQAAAEQTVFNDAALLLSGATLGATLAWRVWCVFFRPAWIGSLAGSKKTA